MKVGVKKSTKKVWKVDKKGEWDNLLNTWYANVKGKTQPLKNHAKLTKVPTHQSNTDVLSRTATSRTINKKSTEQRQEPEIAKQASNAKIVEWNDA